MPTLAVTGSLSALLWWQAARSVELVVFVSVGSARLLVLSTSFLPCLALCILLLVIGHAVGMAIAWPWRHQAHIWRALVFPVGMREFGIAAAVALAVRPGAVGVSGIYGALLMISAPALAGRLRRALPSEVFAGDRTETASP